MLLCKHFPSESNFNIAFFNDPFVYFFPKTSYCTNALLKQQCLNIKIYNNIKLLFEPHPQVVVKTIFWCCCTCCFNKVFALVKGMNPVVKSVNFIIKPPLNWRLKEIVRVWVPNYQIPLRLNYFKRTLINCSYFQYNGIFGIIFRRLAN